jgi:hypothetical protein
MFSESEKKLVEIVKCEIEELLEKTLAHMDIDVHRYVHLNGIVTGGISASLFHNEEINDIDIYLSDQNAIDTFKEWVMQEKNLEQVEDINPKYMVQTDIEGKLITANAVTFKNKIQIITCATKDSRKYFDFVHCMPYYDIATKTYFISKKQYNSIVNKKLVVNDFASMPKTWRWEKFKERGWTT